MQMFFKIGALKNFAKSPKGLQLYKKEKKILRTPFSQNMSGWLVLYQNGVNPFQAKVTFLIPLKVEVFWRFQGEELN